MQSKPTILLTFDVEEFDLPLEYNIPISLDEQFAVGKRGLDAIQPILNDVNTTLFTTARFALQYPNEIITLSERHEIASHSFYHSSFEKKDLLDSRLELERITGKGVYGLRMPRMKKVDIEWIKEAGYKYDSSINPTWLPGRYNNLNLPRTCFKQNDLLRVPTSVSPHLRIPLFWLAFKNLPYGLFKSLAVQTLNKDGYLSLYFHPWEFTDISQYKLPSYVKRQSGKPLLDKLERLITDLKQHASFSGINNFTVNK
jgi:peptidoglycan/xylan/chitin deacetylase (PgdA/CDA1 family)